MEGFIIVENNKHAYSWIPLPDLKMDALHSRGIVTTYNSNIALFTIYFSTIKITNSANQYIFATTRMLSIFCILDTNIGISRYILILFITRFNLQWFSYISWMFPGRSSSHLIGKMVSEALLERTKKQTTNSHKFPHYCWERLLGYNSGRLSAGRSENVVFRWATSRLMVQFPDISYHVYWEGNVNMDQLSFNTYSKYFLP